MNGQTCSQSGWREAVGDTIVVRAPEFGDFGGWSLDTQFVGTMGTPYLLAHGLGHTVEDAKTGFSVGKAGEYTLFAYTFNWVAPWKPEYAPGVFEVYIDGKKAGGPFGDAGASWHWQEGGRLFLEAGEHRLTVHDLTGFEGRVGMLALARDGRINLPETPEQVRQFAYASGGFETPVEEGGFDLVVCGGGISGICAALSAARNGLRVALVQDRPVVGGNNSSEVRVWLGGETHFDPFPGIGNIVNEMEQARVGHYGSENRPENYEDDKKLALLQAEKNITLYLSHIVTDAEMVGNRIAAVVAWDYRGARRRRIRGRLFADCTGDAALGAMAGADFEVTTNGHMGMTSFWYVEDTGEKQDFPACPWAIDLKGLDIPGRIGVKDVYGNEKEKSLGCWFWEGGMEHDPIEKMEYTRDLNLRAMYGAMDALKNHDKTYESHRIGFSAYIGGKRESRRLFGDVIMTKSDVCKGVKYPDSCVPSTWNFDVHYPDRRFYEAFREGDAFITKDYHERFDKPYFIPYRALYSRNIANLFMAGRDISVSHDALGTARVMRTGGMMGEVIGYAAKYCVRYGCGPRGVYESHLSELIGELKAIPRLKKNELVANMPRK